MSQERILVIPSSRIGDAVLSFGLIDAIIKRYKNPAVTVACPSLIADLFTDLPHLKKIIPFEKSAIRTHWLGLWSKVCSSSWDHVIDMRGSALTYFILAKNQTVWHKGNPVDHKVRQISRLINKRESFHPLVWLSSDTLEAGRRIIGRKKTLVLAPAANWLGKQWPIEKFVTVAKRFAERFSNAQIAVITAPHERNVAAPLLELNNVIDLTQGEQPLNVLAAVIRHADLFIGNDSGLMHISAAVGTPTIGLFGPTDNQVYGPWSKVPGTHKVVRTPESRAKLMRRRDFSFKSRDVCYMHSLAVEKVWHALLQLWDQHDAHTNGAA